MSHGLGLGPPAPRSNIFRTMDRPDVPEKWKDPANWPEGLRKEIGDDEGAAFNKRHREEFAAECKKLRAAIDRFNPDFVVFWGDDQYENFKEDIIPAFCIQGYDDMEIQPFMPHGDRLNPRSEAQFQTRQPISNNTWGYPADKTITIRGKREGAKYLASGLINEKIDVAYSYEPLHYGSFAHAFLNSLMFMDFEGNNPWNYPTVTFQVNCYGARVLINKGGHYPVGSATMPEADLDPPGPTPERCMEVGAATARVLQKSPWKVALIATSSWSHAFLVPKHDFIYPDVEADRKMYEALIRGDFDYWRNVPNSEVDIRGHQEVRNWWTMVGALEELGLKEPSYHNYLESYSHNSNKCFAIWDPR
jgi:hypothetical protein